MYSLQLISTILDVRSPVLVPQVKQGAEWLDTKEVAGRARQFVDGCVLQSHTPNQPSYKRLDECKHCILLP
jgi:hypothetical protein